MTDNGKGIKNTNWGRLNTTEKTKDRAT